MSSELKFQGSIIVEPPGACGGSFSPTTIIEILETMSLLGMINMGEYTLATAGVPVAVPLAALGKVNAVFLHASDGGNVIARLTSGQGVAPIPVNPVLFLMSQTVPFTALTIEGDAGANVSVILAEMA